MAQTNEQVSASQNEEVVENKIQTTSNDSYKDIIKKMLSNGCKRINSITIKNVNFTEKDNYTMVSFTLKTPIRGYVMDENGEYKLGMTNTLFTSLFAITGTLKEDEELGWMANALLESPQALNLILNGATVDIIQQDIPQGVEYYNPFSTKAEVDAAVYDHDIIINHIIGFKLGKMGERMSMRLADKLMGFMN